ncbi:hypothetical protein [Pseudomonas putida]
MKKKMAEVAVMAGVAALLSTAACAADWSDNLIGVRYGTHFSEAGVGRGITKTIYSFTHASGSEYGVNFFTLDTLVSDSKDPAANSEDGAQEMYAIYQRTVPLRVLGLTGNSDGIFGKTSALFRFDLGTKNTEFASRPRKIRLGLDLPLPVPAGLWNISLSAYKETNHNGIVGRDVTFDTTWSAGSVWNIPMGPGALGGYLNVTGPKGKDGFGNDTKTEVLLYVSYLFDIGKSGLKIGAAYQHWRNMYGCDESIDQTDGSRGNTPMLVAEYHF